MKKMSRRPQTGLLINLVAKDIWTRTLVQLHKEMHSVNNIKDSVKVSLKKWLQKNNVAGATVQIEASTGSGDEVMNFSFEWMIFLNVNKPYCACRKVFLLKPKVLDIKSHQFFSNLLWPPAHKQRRSLLTSAFSTVSQVLCGLHEVQRWTSARIDVNLQETALCVQQTQLCLHVCFVPLKKKLNKSKQKMSKYITNMFLIIVCELKYAFCWFETNLCCYLCFVLFFCTNWLFLWWYWLSFMWIK